MTTKEQHAALAEAAANLRAVSGAFLEAIDAAGMKNFRHINEWQEVLAKSNGVIYQEVRFIQAFLERMPVEQAEPAKAA